jgi:2-methylcitrate dehydratase PrpD
MSLPFAVATALVKGKPSLKHYVNEGFNDTEILRLSNKVTYHVDPKYGHRFGSAMFRPALEIKMIDGCILREDREIFRYGNPKNPISIEEQIEKFRNCVSYSIKPLSQNRLEQVLKMLLHFEDVADVGRIIQLVS